MPRRYRIKQATVEAVQLTWENWSEMCEHADVGGLENGKAEGVKNPDAPGAIGLAIPTSAGVMIADENDWVVRDLIDGELDVLKPDLFEQFYEAVE